MNKRRKKYSLIQEVSAVFMIVALVWLTISTPFVYASQQQQFKLGKTTESNAPLADTNEEESNPFGNTTEEKAPGNANLAEEFLHDHSTTEHFFSIISHTHQSQNAGTYIAFHGELLVPPPNQA